MEILRGCGLINRSLLNISHRRCYPLISAFPSPHVDQNSSALAVPHTSATIVMTSLNIKRGSLWELIDPCTANSRSGFPAQRGWRQSQRSGRAHRNANATADAGRVGAIERFAFEREFPDINADFAVSRTHIAGDAAVFVGIDPVLADAPARKPPGDELHKTCCRAPIAAPDFSA